MSCDSSFIASTPSTRNTSSSAAGKRLLHEAAQRFRHLGFHLEPDHRSAATALQRGLEQADQIFGLFLDFEFGVADDAEGALALDGVAGKQPADEQAGGLFQRDQVHTAILVGGGE